MTLSRWWDNSPILWVASSALIEKPSRIVDWLLDVNLILPGRQARLDRWCGHSSRCRARNYVRFWDSFHFSWVILFGWVLIRFSVTSVNNFSKERKFRELLMASRRDMKSKVVWNKFLSPIRKFIRLSRAIHSLSWSTHSPRAIHSAARAIISVWGASHSLSRAIASLSWAINSLSWAIQFLSRTIHSPSRAIHSRSRVMYSHSCAILSLSRDIHSLSRSIHLLSRPTLYSHTLDLFAYCLAAF